MGFRGGRGLVRHDEGVFSCSAGVRSQEFGDGGSGGGGGGGDEW